MSDMSGKEKLQTALRCIQVWADAVSQVLEHDDPSRQILVPSSSPFAIPPNFATCQQLLSTGYGPITVAELRAALAQIDALADALRGAIEPLATEPLSGALFVPDIQAMLDTVPPA